VWAQIEGSDFESIGSSLSFNRVLVGEPPIPFWRWILLFLGVWMSDRYLATTRSTSSTPWTDAA
jgi:hypothetical protein